MTEEPRVTRFTGELARPLRHFVQTESGSSALLLGATLLALVWANSPASELYEDLWGTKLTIALGGAEISEDLRHWVNDGLMVFFFYVVGLEIRRELAMGELRDRREAAVPAIAALAGMVVPALVFLAFNAGGDGARGWGIVMATDIAFVLGALALLGPSCPSQVRVFLLTLAIVDDIGAITVIALFHSDGIDLAALAIAAGLLVAIALLRAARAWRGPVYFLAGLGLWLATDESGIHPTIAGVLLGLLTIVHPPQRTDVERATTLTRSFRQSPSPRGARSAMLGVSAAVSPNERLQETIHPWSSYLIVPLFALANAGVRSAPGCSSRRSRRRSRSASSRASWSARRSGSPPPRCSRCASASDRFRATSGRASSSARRRSRGSASPSRCSSPTSPSATPTCATRRRSACSSPRRSRPSWAGSCSGWRAGARTRARRPCRPGWTRRSTGRTTMCAARWTRR